MKHHVYHISELLDILHAIPDKNGAVFVQDDNDGPCIPTGVDVFHGYVTFYRPTAQELDDARKEVQNE